MTPEALEVTDGQDRGARFSLRPGDTTIGRGGQMDIVLTDLSLERLHARLRLADEELTVHDLSGSGLQVNGVEPHGPMALSVGDRVAIGATELTILWTPGAPTPPPPSPRPAAPAQAPPSDDGPQVAPETAVDELEPALNMEIPAAGIALALGLLALVSNWLPFLRRPDGGVDTLWSLEQSGLWIQGVVVGVIATAAAGWWLVNAVKGTGSLPRVPPLVSSIAGAAMCGLPLFALAIPVGRGGQDVGVFVLLVAGLGTIGVAAIGVSRPTAAPAGGVPHVGTMVSAVGAGVGGLMAAISAPLPWLANNITEVSGLDSALRTGRLTLPIGLLAAVVAACGLLAPLIGRPRLEFPLVLGAAGLGMAGFTLALATASAFSSLGPELGLLTTLVGMAIAAASAGVGALWIVLNAIPSLGRPPEPEPEPASRTGSAG